MNRLPDTRFDWLTILPYWGPTGDGCETLEIALSDFIHRSGMTDTEWRFAFVSWASARLIRTGEWYEFVTRETRNGIELLCIVRDRDLAFLAQALTSTTTRD